LFFPPAALIQAVTPVALSDDGICVEESVKKYKDGLKDLKN